MRRASTIILCLFALVVLLSALNFSQPDAVESASVSVLPDGIDTRMAMSHIKHLAGIVGPRPTGSKAERAAGDYIIRSMNKTGCRVSVHEFRLPNGKSSRNIIGVVPGAQTGVKTVVVGAHYDTVSRSPGANDNASGVAVLLELARVIPSGSLPYDLVLIAFGAEEIRDNAPLQQRYGSGKYVASLSKGELDRITTMLCLDMVGAGEGLKIANSGRTDRKTVNQLLGIARASNIPAQYLTNATSDHMAFENKGIPSARLRWWPDKHYHRPTDTPDKIDSAKLAATGELTLKWLASLARG